MNLLNILASTAVLATLAACGGGGTPAASGPVASTEVFQLRQALANDFSDTKSYPYKLTGTSLGLAVTGSGVISQSPILPTTFEGVAARQKLQTASTAATVAGPSGPITVPTTHTTETLIVDSASVPIGYTTASAYGLPLVPLTIPATAKVGDSGSFGTLTVFSSSTKSVVTGSYDYTFSLAADTVNTAILSVTSTSRDSARVVVGTQISTYRITSAGVITKLAITGTSVTGSGTTTLTFTF